MIGLNEIKFYNKRSPNEIPWEDHGIDIILECTGIFTKAEDAKKHLKGSVKKVLISAPASNADITVVYGVNDKLLEKKIDFDMPNWEEFFPVDHVYCCLGTTIKKARSKDNFIKVDHDYPLAFAAAAKKWNTSVFSVITAAGVSTESKFFYNHVKGKLEKNLESLDLLSTLVFRPSLLLGKRKEFRLGEKIGIGFAKVTSWITPSKYRAIHCKDVAKAMLVESFSGKIGFNIISNKSMHQLS